MLNKVPYSKAQFRQAIVLTLSLVTLSQLSSSIDALPAEQDATKEKREAPDATSAISNEEGGDATDDAYWLDLLSQENRFEKRAPNPRDLFNSNYGKRSPSPRDLFAAAYGKRAPNPRDLFANAYGKRSPNPRDLFASVYGYNKRAPNPRDLFANIYNNYHTKRAPNPRDLFASAYGNMYSTKKLRRNDPRSLFQSVYGGYAKRAPSPRDLFASVYSNYGYDKRYSNDGYGSLNFEDSGENKRGMGGGFKANDPRNLFKSVYGYLK